jgi:hypothetical protein
MIDLVFTIYKKKRNEWSVQVGFKVHGSVRNTPLGGRVVKHSLADASKGYRPILS